MVPRLGAPFGFVAANGLFLVLDILLTSTQFENWGWRLTLRRQPASRRHRVWVRLNLGETTAFAPSPGHRLWCPLGEVLAAHRARWSPTPSPSSSVSHTLFVDYLSTVFALGYGAGTLHYDRGAFLGVRIAAILALALGIVLSGIWSDRTSPRRVLATGCAGARRSAGARSPSSGSS